MQSTTTPSHSVSKVSFYDACLHVSELPAKLGFFAGKAVAIIPAALFVGGAKALFKCRLSSFQPKPISEYLNKPALVVAGIGTLTGKACEYASVAVKWAGRIVGCPVGGLIGGLAGVVIVGSAKFMNRVFNTDLHTRTIDEYAFIGADQLGYLCGIALRIFVASLNPPVLAPIMITGFLLEGASDYINKVKALNP